MSNWGLPSTGVWHWRLGLIVTVIVYLYFRWLWSVLHNEEGRGWTKVDFVSSNFSGVELTLFISKVWPFHLILCYWSWVLDSSIHFMPFWQKVRNKVVFKYTKSFFPYKPFMGNPKKWLFRTEFEGEKVDQYYWGKHLTVTFFQLWFSLPAPAVCRCPNPTPSCGRFLQEVRSFEEDH